VVKLHDPGAIRRVWPLRGMAGLYAFQDRAHDFKTAVVLALLHAYIGARLLGVATYGPSGCGSICPGPDTAKAFPNVEVNASVVAASFVAALTTWRFEPVYVDLQTPHLGIEGARGEPEFGGGA